MNLGGGGGLALAGATLAGATLAGGSPVTVTLATLSLKNHVFFRAFFE